LNTQQRSETAKPEKHHPPHPGTKPRRGKAANSRLRDARVHCTVLKQQPAPPTPPHPPARSPRKPGRSRRSEPTPPQRKPCRGVLRPVSSGPNSVSTNPHPPPARSHSNSPKRADGTEQMTRKGPMSSQCSTYEQPAHQTLADDNGSGPPTPTGTGQPRCSLERR